MIQEAFHWPFIDQYNWKDIDFPTGPDSWEALERNNKSIARNILHVPCNTKGMGHAYRSEYNLKCQNEIILLIITDSEKRHYLALKRLSAFFRGVTLNNNGDFYCLNCFNSFRTKNKLKNHIKVFENHDYCYVEMPKEDNKILNYNHGEKSMKFPFIIYADLESLFQKMSTCHNDPKNSPTSKINKHTASGYSLFTHCSFHTTKNKLDYYRAKNCMKIFCLNLREYATKAINYEKKEIIP